MTILDVDHTWTEIEALLSTDPRQELNTAHEVCGRYSTQRDRRALVMRDANGGRETWTYRELYLTAARAASMFASAGLRRGDRVAGLLSRQVESWITALAAWRAGLVYVPLFCGLGTDSLAYRLRASGAKLVVVDQQWRGNLATALASADSSATVVTVTGRQAGQSRNDSALDTDSEDRDFWAEIDRRDADGPEVATTADEAATLLFTSGTTGEPKSCVIPHSGLLSVLPFARHSLGVGENDLVFTTADPGWAYGLYSTGAAPMALGVPRVIYTGDFDADAWWRVIHEEGVTCIAAAPSAYRRLLGGPDQPVALRAAAAAGEPLDTDTATRWAELGVPPIRDGYGLSEVGMVLADLANGRPPQPGTLGGPVPGFDVRLVDEEAQPVPDGQDGYIAIKRPRYQLSTGYENRPEAWDARWRGELFVTEDRAVILPDGRWRYLGRADDMIVTKGYNVSPVEVERVIAEHPGVTEVAVVAAPGKYGGTVVRAVIVRNDSAPSANELEAELSASVAERVGAHARPRLYDYVDALPRNEVGKLQRARLR